MGKRRRSKQKKENAGNIPVDENDNNENTKKLKSENEDTIYDGNDTPEKIFESFISPTGIQDFFNNYWEKKPLLLQRNSADQKSPLFSREIFENLLQENRHKIQFGRDVNVVNFDRTKKQRKDPSVDGKVTLAKFKKLMDVDRATMQIHQPQRFQDSLWYLMERLECYFGCLVGSNVYITPSDAQGLPPHHDDVEVFILQLEGEKHWRLYSPKTELASEYSGDFKTDEIGEPVMDLILKPGDLLYFPRGTIHQAETSNTLSSHITISTYQHNSLGNYLLSVFPQMLEEASKSNVEFRRGLPVNYMSNCPTMASSLTSQIQALLQNVACKSTHVPDTMIADFMANRLPPKHSTNLRDSLPLGKLPSIKSEVRLKYSDHLCIVIKEDDNQDDASSSKSNSELMDNVEEKIILIYYSILNTRYNHMVKEPNGEPEEETSGNAIKFPQKYLESINYLLSNREQFVQASQIPSGKGIDIETFLRALWSVHLLENKNAD